MKISNINFNKINKIIYLKNKSYTTNIGNNESFSINYEKFINKKYKVSSQNTLNEFIKKIALSYKTIGNYREYTSPRQAIASYRKAYSYNPEFSTAKKIADLQIPYDEII